MYIFRLVSSCEATKVCILKIAFSFLPYFLHQIHDRANTGRSHLMMCDLRNTVFYTHVFLIVGRKFPFLHLNSVSFFFFLLFLL